MGNAKSIYRRVASTIRRFSVVPATSERENDEVSSPTPTLYVVPNQFLVFPRVPTVYSALSVLKQNLAAFGERRFLAAFLVWNVFYAAVASVALMYYYGGVEAITSDVVGSRWTWGGLNVLIDSLRTEGTYGGALGDSDVFSRAHRMPFMPLLLAALAQISLNATLITIAKNCLLYAIFAAAAGNLFLDSGLKLYLFAVFGVLFYFNPMFFHAVPFFYEEGYSFILLCTLFCLILLNRESSLLIGSVIAGLVYLLKSTLSFAAYGGSILIFLKLYRTRKILAVVSLLPLALAILGWGGFTQFTTERFAVGSSLSSLNGYNFYKGNNPETDRYYPSTSLDRMEGQVGGWLVDLEGNAFSGEWDSHDYYMERAREYIAGNPLTTLNRLLLRTHLTFIEVGDWARSEGGFSMAPFLTLSRITLWLSIVAAVSALVMRSRNYSADAVVFLVLIALIALPLIAGFVYQRHLIPMLGIGVIYFTTQAVPFFSEFPRRYATRARSIGSSCGVFPGFSK